MSISLLPEVDPTMQPYTPSQRARLLPSRSAAAAVLTAAAILGAAAPSALAQSDGWEHYDVAAPKTITLEFDTDLLAFDLCWSDHTEQTKEQIVNAAIAQMTSPGQLHVIDMPGLPPFYRRTSNASVWRDLDGDVIRSMDILPNRRNYHIDVEQALIDIAGRIREARPGAKLAFKGFELQPLPGGRPPAYEQLGAVQDFYITDRTIYLNHVGGLLDHALNSTFYRARVDFANAQDNWLVFPNQNGQFSLASLTTPDWPPAEFEPEILALWGGDGDDGGGGGEALPLNDSVVLVPGDGFPEGWGENVQAIGSPDMAGYDAKAIARWNVVPYQTIEDEPFSVGVVAFHINEIDRIEFYLEGGPGITVTEMTHNPRTDTWEYWAVLDPDVFLAMNHPDGPIELRAIAYPKGAGEPRVLEPLMLNTNAGQTLPKPVMWCAPWGSDETGDGSQENPFRQPGQALVAIQSEYSSADGAMVYLLEGDYGWGPRPSGAPQTEFRWATIAGAPGTQREGVRFIANDADGMRTANIAVSGVSFVEDATITTAGGGVRKLWIDNALLIGSDSHEGGRAFVSTHFSDGVYVTGSRFADWRHGPLGSELCRDVDIIDIGEDSFTNCKMVINCSVDGIDKGETTAHPDVFQLHASQNQSNYIVYGLVAVNANAQGIFARSSSARFDDIAFVNVLIAKPTDLDPGTPYYSQWMASSNHLIFRGVTLPNTSLVWRSADLTNVTVDGCVLYKMMAGPSPGEDHYVFEENWFGINHFIDTYSHGARVAGEMASVGDAMFVNALENNYNPRSESPLRARMTEGWLPVDAIGQERLAPDTLGALR